MKEFCKWMDDQSKIVQIIFCLPILDILWGIYRIGGAIANKNWVHLILAIVWTLWAGWIGWVLDLVCIIVSGHICWFKE